MNRLDTRIPPPLVMVLCGALAWGAAQLIPAGRLTHPAAPLTGGLLVAVGIALNGLPKRDFRHAGTTVNPLRPQAATRLVVTGLHRFSRNPMYLGHAVILLGVALLLEHLAALVAVPAYMAYVTRFQIRPEERALRARFGAFYLDYCNRVRRWL